MNLLDFLITDGFETLERASFPYSEETMIAYAYFLQSRQRYCRPLNDSVNRVVSHTKWISFVSERSREVHLSPCYIQFKSSEGYRTVETTKVTRLSYHIVRFNDSFKPSNTITSIDIFLTKRNNYGTRIFIEVFKIFIGDARNSSDIRMLGIQIKMVRISHDKFRITC